MFFRKVKAGSVAASGFRGYTSIEKAVDDLAPFLEREVFSGDLSSMGVIQEVEKKTKVRILSNDNIGSLTPSDCSDRNIVPACEDEEGL